MLKNIIFIFLQLGLVTSLNFPKTLGTILLSTSLLNNDIPRISNLVSNKVELQKIKNEVIKIENNNIKVENNNVYFYGSVDSNGVLTNGDVQSYWTSIGISSGNHPRVIVKTIDGATNSPNINDGGSTIENTLDVETIGGACPSSNLTIILYIGPNTLNEMYNLFNYMINTTITVNGVNYKPTILSCSWGAPEIYFSNSLITNISGLLKTATENGINICSATGDNGSNDGVGGSGNYTDFPSSSPYVTAVGGTSLVCPNNVYDNSTSETAWSSGGGAVSSVFSKPSYQTSITASGRSIPDLAADADPYTGVLYTVNGNSYIYGGTSVAAPIIAGFLASINCTIFINPLIYQLDSSYFHDIRSGSNGGFSAGTGYDNCTGIGSINGSNLKNALTGISVTGVNLNQSSVTLNINQTYQFISTISPADASNKSVVWSSSSVSTVSVSSSGLATGLKVGSATITVRTVDGSFTASATVTVIVSVTSITLSASSLAVNVGLGKTLIATVNPSNATNKSVIWTTANSAIATVSSGGLVDGIANGSTTITATTAVGGFTASASVVVTTLVTGVQLNVSSLTLNVRQTYQLVKSIFPVSASNQTVTWVSSRPSVVSVSNTGLLTGLNTGSSTITVTTQDGAKTATATIVVVIPVTSVSLNNSTLNLRV
jgi:uncharacterized protein YjdB